MSQYFKRLAYKGAGKKCTNPQGKHKSGYLNPTATRNLPLTGRYEIKHWGSRFSYTKRTNQQEKAQNKQNFLILLRLEIIIKRKINKKTLKIQIFLHSPDATALRHHAVSLPPIPPLHAAPGAARGKLRRRRPPGSLVA